MNWFKVVMFVGSVPSIVKGVIDIVKIIKAGDHDQQIKMAYDQGVAYGINVERMREKAFPKQAAEVLVVETEKDAE